MADDRNSGVLGLVIAVVGGLLAAGGVFLTWGKAAISMPGVGTERYSVAGSDISNGSLVMWLGIVCVVAAVVTYLMRGKPAAMLLALVTIAAGAFAAIIGIMAATGLQEALVDPIVAQAGVPAESFNDAARQILLDSMASNAGWGLYFSILGGMVGALGGVLLLLAQPRPQAASAATEGDDVEANEGEADPVADVPEADAADVSGPDADEDAPAKG